jgi:L-tartrate/succinate antiporter
VPLWAARELEKLGQQSAMKSCCWCLSALMMWIFAAEWIEPALAALLVIVLMLWTGVLSWNDITSNKAAWNTFTVRHPGCAGRRPLLHRFIAWLGKEGGALMSGISPGMATVVLLLAFYLLHYLFASTTAHTALLPAMLTIASTIPGMNMQVFVLLMVTSLGVMGIITPYEPAPAQSTTAAAICRPKTTGVSAPFSAPSSCRPAADWLSVDVHDVLIHNRRE